MKVTLNRINDNLHFEGRGQSGVPLNIDPDGEGASPMELLLMGVGSCSAVDIVSILQKQRQKITDYKMEVTGEREVVRAAKPFKNMHVKIFLEGEIEVAKAKRAARLSFDKYCSVSITMEGCVQVSYSLFVNGEAIAV